MGRLLAMVILPQKNATQVRLASLKEKGWSWAAIADELGLTVNAVEKWVSGHHKPAKENETLRLLDQLIAKKRIPKRRRYTTPRFTR